MSYVTSSIDLPAWIGTLPEDWTGDWLKWSVSLKAERATAEEQERLPYLSNENIESWTGRLLGDVLEPVEADSRRFVAGDVLFNKLRPYLAKVFHAEFEGASSGELLCLRSSNRVLPRYLFYVLTSWGFIDAVDAETFGSKMPRADWETVGHQPLPLPPLETQRRIACLLDEKTTRVDALIARKRTLLERLAEKRQALITQAVTKGLDPSVPMKGSGIDWLDQVPAHWQTGNLRRFATMKTGHTPSRQVADYWEDCEIPWFTLADVWQLRDGTRKYLSETAEKISELGLENSAAELLPEGTVVFSRTASIGFSGIMPRPMATSQDFWNWVCGPKLNPEYLLYLFRAMRQKFDQMTSGSTHKTIYQPVAAGLEICVPTLDEQAAIAQFIDGKTLLIDRASTQVASSIARLVEYRAALITAAVTGQLQVEPAVRHKEAAHA